MEGFQPGFIKKKLHDANLIYEHHLKAAIDVKAKRNLLAHIRKQKEPVSAKALFPQYGMTLGEWLAYDYMINKPATTTTTTSGTSSASNGGGSGNGNSDTNNADDTETNELQLALQT